MIDLGQLLQAVSADNPAGEDIEYDPGFVALEMAAKGSPDKVMGDAVVSGTPPDWRSVRSQSLTLFARSKDLRVAVYLTRALLHIDGVPGFSEGLSLLRGLLENYWETLFPELDPSDPDDPTRANVMANLCDREAVISPLELAPLVEVRGLGRFSLRHIRIARDEMPLPSHWEGPVPELAIVNGAFMECDLEDLTSIADALGLCQQELQTIDALIVAKLGSGRGPDFTVLSAEINHALKIVAEYLASRGAVAPPAAGDASAGDEQPAAGAAAGSAPMAILGEIQSRDDAMKMMEKISEFYQKHEPSSPVPLLMQRAKRLAEMDFMDILNDIAPEGLKQAENLRGKS